MTDTRLCIEELSLSGSICLGQASKSAVYRHAKAINAALEKDHANWRVKVDTENLIIHTVPYGERKQDADTEKQ